MTGPTRVALVGTTGHGASHLRTIAALQAAGRVELVGLADIADLTGVATDVPRFRRHTDLFDETAPDVVVICTPPHTHRPIAEAALRSGADVLLEKPPVLDLTEHDELMAVLDQTGRAIQVGFQALGSAALTELSRAIAAGRLGQVAGIGVRAAWFREDGYFQRSAWVGRRTVDGRPGLDGALANPFAHAVMQVLAIADAPLRTVEVERYRTRAIEVDDTACLRLVFDTGVTAVIAVSLCAAEFVAGEITVTGSTGTAILEYPTDRLSWSDRPAWSGPDPHPGLDALPGLDADPGRDALPGPAGQPGRGARPGPAALVEVPGRVGLLDNLLDHRADPDCPLIAPLARTRRFTALLAPILAAPPIDVESTFLDPHPGSPGQLLRGVNAAIDAAARELALFSELRPPVVGWARPSP